VFRRRRWFQGRPVHGGKATDIAWFTPDGGEMDDNDWEVSFARSLQVFLNGRDIATPDMRGEPIVDDSFLMLFNGHDDVLTFTLPPEALGSRWAVLVDTSSGVDVDEDEVLEAGQARKLVARSLLVLREVTG